MLHRFRESFGTAGLIVAVVALVAAIGGSAIAANTASDSAKRNAKAKKKKGVTVQQVRKIAKQEARKFANSNPGPAGPQGPAGAKGDTGAAGSNGKDGSNGSNGTSATTATFAGAKGSCTEGGVEVESASPDVLVCNGTAGSPWTAGGTLPSGETETGAWQVVPAQSSTLGIVISFPIPLAAPLTSPTPAEPALPRQVHYVKPNGMEVFFNTTTLEPGDEQAQTACDGNAADPKADPGHLCIYQTGALSGGTFFAVMKPDDSSEEDWGASRSGARLFFEAGQGFGTWALTAP